MSGDKNSSDQKVEKRETAEGWKIWEGKSTYIGDFLEGKFANLRAVERTFGRHPAIGDLEATHFALQRPPVFWGPFGGPLPFRPQIALDQMTHDTTASNAEGIIRDGFDWKFSKAFKIGKNGVKFSWWRMKIPPKASLDYIRQIQFLFQSFEYPPLGTSPIFNKRPSQTFGNYRFTVPIAFLLESYKSSMGCEFLDCRVLGTVYFEKGVMYALVICPKNQPELKNLPSFAKHQDLYVNIQFDGHTLIWRPFSTSNDERLWDQVCFAFYLEPGKNFMPQKGTWEKFGKCLESSEE